MAKRGDTDRKRAERGMMLRLLVIDESSHTLVTTLYSMLDRRGFSLTKRGFSFNLEYLEKAGWIQVRRVRDFPDLLGEDDALAPDTPWDATWTQKGLHLANGELEDPEVTL